MKKNLTPTKTDKNMLSKNICPKCEGTIGKLRCEGGGTENYQCVNCGFRYYFATDWGASGYDKVDVGKRKIYLSGAIQKSPDPFTWRKKVNLELKGLYDIIIPEDKTMLPKNATFEQKIKSIKNNVVIKDIEDVLSCDYFLLKLDYFVFVGAGTVSEITYACMENMPIVCFFEGITMEEIPTWTQGCLADALLVKDLDAAIKHYKKIALEK